MEKLNRTEAKERVSKFFESIKSKNKEEVKKIKKLAMHNKIRLGKLKMLFCKHCFSTRLTVRRIKKGYKILECRDCKKSIKFKLA